tara:strand:+ start:1051 stop:1371 length:321 start_codon:yes stop_codon:yes gene_type:complete
MAQLSNKIKKYIGGVVDFRNDVILKDDGDGVVYIAEWNLDSPAKPTDAQLNALESDADDYEYNLGQIEKRKAEYGTLEQQMENVMENGVTAEKNRVQAIKDKYPKK